MNKEEKNAVREIIRLNIIKYRKRKGLSQKDLAELVDLSNKSVNSWEVGKSLPDLATLYQLCQIFGISLNEMYGVKTETANNDLLETLIQTLQKLKEGE